MFTEIRAKAAHSTARAIATVSSKMTAGSAAKRVPTLSTVMMLTLMSVSSAASLPGSASAQAATNAPATTTTAAAPKAAAPAYTKLHFQEEAAALGIVVTPKSQAQSQAQKTPTASTTPPKPTNPPPPVSAPPASVPVASGSVRGVTTNQPCQSTTYFVANINEWAVPPGCFGAIYTPSVAAYGARPDYGYCNWWPEALNPTHPDILSGGEYTRSSVPVPGAVVWEAPGTQGASAGGHYAQVVAVAPGGYWVLITEMNFYWRGGGYGKVDYRYIHVGAGVTFIYP